MNSNINVKNITTPFELLASAVSPINNTMILNIILSDKQWAELPSLAKRHKLTPAFYIKVLERKLDIPHTVLKQLQQNALYKTAQLLQLTSELVRIGCIFTNCSIDYISLKGPALAMLLYNDYAGKQSGDLDILVSEDRIWDASKLLTDNGYMRQYLPDNLTKSQTQYILQSYHHISFVHKEKKCFVELHWRLNTNKYAEPFSFAQMWRNVIKVNVGNSYIPCLCPQQSLIHQLIHGSGHAWFALAWLRDTTCLALRKDVNLNEVWEWAVTNGYERMIAQGLLLANRVFEPFLELSLKSAMTSATSPKIIHSPYLILTSNEVPSYLNAPNVGRIKQKLYMSKLKSDWLYKKQVWTVVGTNPRDWFILKLPNQLFFLYFVLRPFLYLYTVYMHKNRH